MIEENIKSINDHLATIAENVAQLTKIALATQPQKENASATEKTVEEQPVISAFEINGEKFVRVHVGKYDFKIPLHDAPTTMSWDDANAYAKERNMRLFEDKEGHLMYVFKDEINNLLEELGGERLREDDAYWTGTEYNRSYARIVGFNSGYAYSYISKYYGFVVRPVAA